MSLKKIGSMMPLVIAFLLAANTASAIQLSGQTDIHDPSTIHRDGDTYWTFGTGDGIATRHSTDLLNWSYGNSVFPRSSWPGWINQSVTNFGGNFWAPDMIKMNGRYYLYYSAFATTNGGFESAIGVAVTDSLNNPNWQDLGMVVSSRTEPRTNRNEPINTIDAGVYRDTNNNVWMVYGSHYGGLFIVQINPATGKRMNSTRYPAVGNNGAWNEFEGAQVQHINGYYYMFVNLGECCAGNQSDYYIVAGRSNSPTGPFLDRNGRDLYNYGGTTVLSTDGRYIGPGHFGYFNNNGQDLATIHYYDGNTSNGWPSRLDILELNFSGGWPTFNRNFTLNSGGDNEPKPNPDGIRNGRVAMISALSGKAVEVASASQSDGANIQQWAYHGGSNQHWDITDLGNGYYSIRAAHSGKSMDVYAWSTEDGGEIRQWSWLSGANQQWEFVDQGNSYYAIISRHSGLALDVYNFSMDDGGDIRQWSYWGGETQQFRLEYQ